ncbi:WGR domain-containing protein [Loktanella salsilacus]|jgi:predicted DNA-binding WGR domain protein|uniref:WGR domain-containing protein n=1 Tax=Loktanella salsilacus TaxID=195913 RepID=UPI0020B77E2E|nr:WGR domain-containing protein [Loktanella salsilacus]UTH48875.1 WGR domain-containing protein [Loktanella salsilacus]
MTNVQIEMFPTSIRLQRRDPDRNMQRFYLMTVQADLFGGTALIREWGRIGAGGQIVREVYPDEGQAIDALAQMAKIKSRRGYGDV